MVDKRPLKTFRYKVTVRGVIKAESKKEVEGQLSSGFDGWDDITSLDYEVYEK